MGRKKKEIEDNDIRPESVEPTVVEQRKERKFINSDDVVEVFTVETVERRMYQFVAKNHEMANEMVREHFEDIKIRADEIKSIGEKVLPRSLASIGISMKE